MTKFGVFFSISLVKKYVDFRHKSVIQRIILKKCTNFDNKSGEKTVKIEDEAQFEQFCCYSY